MLYFGRPEKHPVEEVLSGDGEVLETGEGDERCKDGFADPSIVVVSLVLCIPRDVEGEALQVLRLPVQHRKEILS